MSFCGLLRAGSSQAAPTTVILVSKKDMLQWSDEERTRAEHCGFEANWGQLLPVTGRSDALYGGIEPSPVHRGDPRAPLFPFAALAEKLPSGTYTLQGLEAQDWTVAGLGWGLGRYRFDRYKEKKATKNPQLILPEHVDVDHLEHLLAAIYLARDLINTPALDQSPETLCDQATVLSVRFGAQLAIRRGEELLEDGFPAIHAVGMGSDRPPALIDLTWGDETAPKLTLVGKGVVFDTGGLNLKQGEGMRWMKKDMGGAAVTMALAQLIMASGLKVRLRLLIPAVENSIGPKSYRPGDVIATRKGIHVEIGNTDAEGRVILCDALTEAVAEHPDLLIDMATLTGAARIALGEDLPPFYTPNPELAARLKAQVTPAMDPVWEMPLWAPYRPHLDSQIADLNNMAGTPLGGSLTAALYLHQFVKPLHNWIHFDIFGWRNTALPGMPKGGEATALRALFHFIAEWAADHDSAGE
jgi:leucyl aminopeptidase